MMDDFSMGDVMKDQKPLMSKWKINLIIGIALGLIILVAIIVIIVISAGSSSKSSSGGDDRESEKVGEIFCIYEINSKGTAQILGNEFSKNSDFNIFVNGELIKFSKEYTFNSSGKFNVKYVLYNDNEHHIIDINMIEYDPWPID